MTEYPEKVTWQKIADQLNTETTKAHDVGCACIHCGAIAGITSAGCAHTFANDPHSFRAHYGCPMNLQGGIDV